MVVGPGGGEGEGEDEEFPGQGSLSIGNPPRPAAANAGRSCGLAQEDRQRRRSAGFNHHLAKPADPGKLLGLLRWAS